MSAKIPEQGDDDVLYDEEFDTNEEEEDDDDDDDEDYVPEKFERSSSENSDYDYDYGEKKKSKKSPSKRRNSNKAKEKKTKTSRRSTRKSEPRAPLRRSSRNSRSDRVSYAEMSGDDWDAEEDSSQDEQQRHKKQQEKKKRVEEIWSTFSQPPPSKRPRRSSTTKAVERKDESAVTEPSKNPRENKNKELDESSNKQNVDGKIKVDYQTTDNDQQKERGKDEEKTKIHEEIKTKPEEIKKVQSTSKCHEENPSVLKSTFENTSPDKQGKDKNDPPKSEATTAKLTQPQSKGLAGVLGKFDKKKTSILDKSKLDWDEYKECEGIEDELKANRNSGYLDKQEFLQRVDYQQWENERELRLYSNRK